MATPSETVSIDQLQGMELFQGLSRQAWTEIGARSQVKRWAKGSILFSQGAAADRSHALLFGCVRIAQSSEQGGQLVVRFVGPGDMFGTMALFTDGCYPAEAVAVIDSVEISWAEPVLIELIQRHPKIALNLVKIIGARLREVQERLREFATERVECRIARGLLRLTSQNAVPNGHDAAMGFPVTRQDVGQMCGATLYTASRILRSWERAGWISTRRGHLMIHKPAELRRIARTAICSK